MTFSGQWMSHVLPIDLLIRLKTTLSRECGDQERVFVNKIPRSLNSIG